MAEPRDSSSQPGDLSSRNPFSHADDFPRRTASLRLREPHTQRYTPSDSSSYHFHQPSTPPNISPAATYRESLHETEVETDHEDAETGHEDAETDHGEAEAAQERRLVIGVDFGTTYTGVAWATPVGNVAKLRKIDIVLNWGDQMGNSKKVPSVISYTIPSSVNKSRRYYQQWGSDLSENAVAIVNTKLQLDIENVLEELHTLRSILDGVKDLNYQYVEQSRGRPNFPRKGPEAIVTDYLGKVFRYAAEAVDLFSPEVRRRFPTDIVATIPNGWEYPAINSTYRALTRAGFNKEEFEDLREVLLVREPEAAAVYTARYLKETQKGFLRNGDSFVLCDAGGGTVDLVSYRVRRTDPLELQLVGTPVSDKCGSTYIDLAFKQWLKTQLGDRIYQTLDPENAGEIRSHTREGRAMRDLMKKFDECKRGFGADPKDSDEEIQIALPDPLRTTSRGNYIKSGVLTIPEDIMKELFDRCVDRIIEMIDGQMDMVEQERGREIKDVVLVGGFGESPYLRSEFEFAARLRNVTVHVPDTAITAVVRGAVVVGIEKTNNTNFMKVYPCPRNYGFHLAKAFSRLENEMNDLKVDPVTGEALAVSHMEWVIRMGDAMLSNQPRKVEQVFITRVTRLNMRRGEIILYTYPWEEVPTRFRNDPDILPLHTLRYDLLDTPVGQFMPRKTSKKAPPEYYAALRVELIMRKKSRAEQEFVLDVALYFGNRRLDGTEIDVE